MQHQPDLVEMAMQEVNARCFKLCRSLMDAQTPGITPDQYADYILTNRVKVRNKLADIAKNNTQIKELVDVFDALMKCIELHDIKNPDAYTKLKTFFFNPVMLNKINTLSNNMLNMLANNENQDKRIGLIVQCYGNADKNQQMTSASQHINTVLAHHEAEKNKTIAQREADNKLRKERELEARRLEQEQEKLRIQNNKLQTKLFEILSWMERMSPAYNEQKHSKLAVAGRAVKEKAQGFAEFMQRKLTVGASKITFFAKKNHLVQLHLNRINR